MNELATLINGFTTLMVTMDPPGMVPIFLALTVGMTQAQRRSVAVRGTLITFGLLLAFALFGDDILNALGISMSAFRIAGGILLFWIGVEMIFEKRQERKEKTTETAITKDKIANLAAFPLAMPLIAGPGTISATILLGSSMETALDKLALVLMIAIACLVVFVAMLMAGLIDKVLGETGRNILTRILGMMLTALAVQFVIDGVKTALPA
ncbi:MarC family protein [Martelella soudanensis]|uniref:MarC family protein n=1 Tax=unclassified Martelella TaxID=2629616 RepID=UPI0015DF9A4D|nr:MULTISPECIES: MarC family protein [unclassified Martelella]